VDVVTQAQVSGLEGGNGMLEAVRWRLASGEEVRRPIRHLFLFIGARPNSNWLSGFVKVDPKGFVLTGKDAAVDRHLLETSRRGVFAIGEGAQVVAALHNFLSSDASVQTPGSLRRPLGE
jgi:thioredoxin reductase (NADPH)